MASRKRIGICYNYSEGWIAGTYYIENLISALNTLPEVEKPHIVLLTNHRYNYLVARKKINYPYIIFQIGSGEKNRTFQLINKITTRLFGQAIFRQKIKNLDAVFPFYNCIQQSLAKRKIYWIADFQEHFGQEFFDQEMIAARKRSQIEIQSSDENLVLSSNDSLGHFNLIYPGHTVKVAVLPFAVTHPDYSLLDINYLLGKFNLPTRYFICPNQFWKHKNQNIVLQALKDLKDRGTAPVVAFTGNTEDQRNPGYFQELQAFVEQHQLEKQVRFLGFIDRKEQLQLMNNALAIIQPSLFEGWSTVVEDAKAMNKPLVVSDINVHREQLAGSAALFFDPKDFHRLSAILENVYGQSGSAPLFAEPDYRMNVQRFGRGFMQIACAVEVSIS